MTPSNTKASLDEIRRNRLAILEEQQARFGYSAPAHIVMEIRELRQELGLPTSTYTADSPGPTADPTSQVAPVVEAVATTLVDPAPDAARPATPRVPDLIEYIKRHLLVAYTIVWLVSALFIMGALNEAFEFSQYVQRMAYSLLALAGGLAILGISLLPAYRSQYKLIDRLLTLLVTLVAAGLAAWLAYGTTSGSDVVDPISVVWLSSCFALVPFF